MHLCFINASTHVCILDVICYVGKNMKLYIIEYYTEYKHIIIYLFSLLLLLLGPGHIQPGTYTNVTTPW